MKTSQTTLFYSKLHIRECVAVKHVDYSGKILILKKIQLQLNGLGIMVAPISLKHLTATILVEKAVMRQLETYKKWCKQKLLSYGLKLMDDDEYENDDTFVFI
ncbi:hypothetical protein [Lysinibacillus sp. FSL R7-0073]|uniref:hypothetical protein n=1 Tax=Lysinibacillus sp. FSL R7-0073 TaxID=2921669 RepID=UPI004046A52F